MKEINKRFDKVDERLDKVENRLDKIDLKIVEMDSDIKTIKEDMVTKSEFSKMMTTIDGIAVTVKKIDEERVVTNNRIQQIEAKKNVKE